MARLRRLGSLPPFPRSLVKAPLAQCCDSGLRCGWQRYRDARACRRVQGAVSFARYPAVPGHEIAGVIEEVGEDVGELRPGARVGLSALFSSCGCCKQCLDGDESLCSQMQFTGVTQDGGCQQFMLAPAAYIAPLPDRLDFVEAAPLMCAGLTVFSGLRRSGFEPSDKVAIIGLDGLGHMGVLFVRALGGRVTVLSTSADKEAEARGLGTERFVNLKTESASHPVNPSDAVFP
jgi:alcohol dehydrogenase, propanol-preferring